MILSSHMFDHCSEMLAIYLLSRLGHSCFLPS
nr:MAG TPA: hypothetical protein [Caudoviricetes sp.]